MSADSDSERLKKAVEEIEVLLRAHRGNVTELARENGRSRKQVYRWLDAHGLDPERFRDG